MTRFELVIFDCDGVLVDSETIANRVFCRMLNELGVEVTLSDMFDRFVGHSMAYCMEQVTQLLDQPPPTGFEERYWQQLRRALTTELQAIPGVAAALDRIRLPICVASSGDHEKMRTTLNLTGLMSRFEGRLFSVTEVAHAKPAPDVFLHAAERCGVSPVACAVVEDTPIGVAAGVAAGMTVYGYAGLTLAARLRAAGAHDVFDDMAQLPALLGQD
jgi:HAD superfamily hydrolase (TIGR01509 family)